MSEVKQLAYALGAQIEGVRVSEPLSDVQTAFIKKIWHEHHIVLFREQNAEPREIIEFAGNFAICAEKRKIQGVHKGHPIHSFRHLYHLL